MPTLHHVELLDVYRKSFPLIYWINAPLTVTTNVFLIFALLRTSQLRNTTIKLLVAVMFSDTCGGIVVFPLLGATLATTESGYNCLIRKVTEYLAIACAMFSPYTFVLASVNRYLQIKRPNIIISNFQLTLAVTGSIVLANVTSTMALLYPSFYSRLIFNIFWCCIYSIFFL